MASSAHKRWSSGCCCWSLTRRRGGLASGLLLCGVSAVPRREKVPTPRSRCRARRRIPGFGDGLLQPSPLENEWRASSYCQRSKLNGPRGSRSLRGRQWKSLHSTVRCLKAIRAYPPPQPKTVQLQVSTGTDPFGTSRASESSGGGDGPHSSRWSPGKYNVSGTPGRGATRSQSSFKAVPSITISTVSRS